MVAVFTDWLCPGSKYWRYDYRHMDKRKTLPLDPQGAEDSSLCGRIRRPSGADLAEAKRNALEDFQSFGSKGSDDLCRN